MMKKIFGSILLIVLLSTLTVWAQGTYSRKERKAYIQSSLEAMLAQTRDQLDDEVRYIRNSGRRSCKSSVQQIKIQCLIDLARSNCSKKKNHQACILVADVAVANMIEEDNFITRRDLIRVLRQARGAKDQMMVTLMGRYGRLAIDFLEGYGQDCSPTDNACLAETIESFCSGKTNTAFMSWQGCTSALIWFIGYNSKVEGK